ncbi:Tyrosine kinase family catalytic domain protein [Ceratobasidium sp. AG-Ba]|nr:Tyrosine kinase family catalytic domain protein [Ceratobasidium sp. AG-Ba]
MARVPRTPSPTRKTRQSQPRVRASPTTSTPPRRGVLQPVPSNDRMPLERPRRLDTSTYSSGSARKRKRRALDENVAPAATRSGLKRRKSVAESPPDGDDDTDAMELDSGTSTHGDEESQTQSDEHLIHRAAAWQLRRLRKDALVRLYMLASGPECIPDPSTELTKPELIDALLGARSASSLPTPSRSPPDTRASKDREIKDLPARPRRRTVSHPAPSSVPASLSCDGGDEADPDAPSSKRLKLAKRRTVPAIGVGAPSAHRITRTRSAQIDKSHPAFASGSDLTEPDSPVEDTPRAQPSPRRLRSSTSRSEVAAPPSPILTTRKRRNRTKHHQLRTPPSDDGDDEGGITSAEELEPPSPADVVDASHIAQLASDDENEPTAGDETVRVLRNRKVVRRDSDADHPADDGDSSDLTELDSEDEGDITMRPTLQNEEGEEEEGGGEGEDVETMGEEGEEEEEEEDNGGEDEGEDEMEQDEDEGDEDVADTELNDAVDDDLDIDLASATDKSLLRLKRDALLRLCECRAIPASGTKPQLVQALLGWRDKAESSGAPSSVSELSELSDPESPISDGASHMSEDTHLREDESDGGSELSALSEETVIVSPAGNSKGKTRAPSTAVPRAPSTKKPNKRRTPVLERSSRVHVSDQPDTPRGQKQSSAGIVGGNPVGLALGAANGLSRDELEIDLEELGLEDKEIPPDKLVKLEKIGSGGFKDVYIGRLRGRAKVAIAEFRGQLSATRSQELKLLRDFDHPNVVRFLGVSIPENPRDTPVMMVSELCANGDLFDYIRNVPVPPLRKVLSLMLDIARGIKYLHEHKPPVIHRDCKSSNILITSKVTAKIADFGLAKVKQSTRSMVRSLVGTVNWQAPELWHAHPKYDYKVDVYSCACVFWEMMQWHLPTKKYPWEGMNEHAIYEAVGSQRRRPSTTGLRREYCPEIVDLVEKMWAQDARDRPTIKKVVEELDRLLDIY